MIGSDWPVCALAGAYANVMQVDEQAHVWSHNARQFYNLP